MEVFNLLQHSDNNLKTSRSLFQYHRDKPALDNIGAIVGFSNSNATDLMKKYQIIKVTVAQNFQNNGTIKISKKFLENPQNVTD